MLIRTDEVRRACANPLGAWNRLHRWAQLARGAKVPYGEIMRYRRELLDDREFQQHVARCLDKIDYVMPGAAELYAIVRAVKPRVIVETGVASGISSAHILRALQSNGGGALHSIDLPNVQEHSVLPPGRRTGWIVPEELRGRWDLHLGDSSRLLPEVLGSLGHVDMFLHDSDHSYEHMSFEFDQAFAKLEGGGLLMSDDTHLHSAWDDFCAKQGLKPTRVGRLGVTRKRRNP